MTIERTAAVWITSAALCSSAAWADPPAPKVCVAVAGDPDESVRAAAETLTDAIGSTSGLRGVADSDSRAALRGESPTPDGAQDLASERHALRATDADSAVLTPMADRLGCAWFVEVSARPAGFALRLFDSVHHTWAEGREVSTIDPALVTTWIASATHPAASSEPARGPARPLAQTTPTAAPQRSFLQRAWPWMLVGGAAAAVVAVYFLSSNDTAGDVTLRVVHGGAR